MAFTKINAAGIGTTETVTVDGLTVINDGSFGGNLTVSGVLTYEDVTNVDSVGLITARNGIVVGSGITLSKDGDIFATGITTVSGNVKVGTGITLSPDGDGFFTGVITATSYSGIDLSDVTGATGDFSIADKIVHTGDTDTAIRFSGADTITAETGGSSRFKIDSSGNVTIGNDGDSGSNPSSGYDELCIEGGNEAIGMCFLSPAANDVEQTIAFGDSNNNQSGKIQYEHANDAMHFDTGGSERVRITSAGHFGVGLTPADSFSFGKAIDIGTTTGAFYYARDTDGGSDAVGGFGYSGSALYIGNEKSDGYIRFSTNTSATERMRIDSAGRVLIGTTSNTFTSVGSSRLQVSGTGADTAGINLVRTSNDGGGAFLQFTKNRGSATQSGDTCGAISWMGHDGTDVESYLALIRVKAGATATSNSMTGDIVFETANGSSVTSERMRLDSSGNFGIGNRTSSPDNLLHVHTSSGDAVIHVEAAADPKLRLRAHNGQSIIQFADAASSNTGEIVYDHASDYLKFQVNASETLRITSTGRVSIGNNASPDGNLHVFNSSAGSVLADTSANLAVFESGETNSGITLLSPNTGKQNIYFGTTGTGGSYEAGIRYTHESHGTTADRRSMHFRVGGNERVRIQGGMLRVGDSLATASAGKFQVIEESSSDQTNDCNAYFETAAADWNIKTYYNRSGAHYHMSFVEQGSDRGNISGNDGANVTYNQGSDYRWKENVVRMTGDEGIEICKKLKPSKYNWIENREATGKINTVDGFIAHEVEEAGVLGAVSGEKDAVYEDGSIKGQMLDYGQVTPVLSAAIKGLIEKVETLEAKVAALEG